MHLFITACLLFIVSIINVGCNTMEGLGKDIKHGGENIEKTAEKHK
jgi:predicted small secreted protein